MTKPRMTIIFSSLQRQKRIKEELAKRASAEMRSPSAVAELILAKELGLSDELRLEAAISTINEIKASLEPFRNYEGAGAVLDSCDTFLFLNQEKRGKENLNGKN